MSKGDTTVHVDFEVGGASAAKMTVMDIYRAQQANASKVNEAARALSKEQNITFSEAKKALREWVRMQTQAANEAAAAQKKAESQGASSESAKEQARLSLARQKSKALEAQFIEAERNRKRAADEAAAEQRRAEAQRAAEQAVRERARISLAAQKSKALEAQFMETERKRKRSAEEAIRDAKRVAREEIRESKRVAREKERDLKMEQSQRGSMNKLMGRGLWGAAMGVAGYAGVAGISNVFSSVSQGIQDIISKRAELEKAVTPLLMLENNVGKMGAIRKEVVSTSIAMGRSYEEVGRFYADLVGSTGNLSSEQRTQLVKETKELANLTGGSLVTAQNLLTKSYQIYGNELESVNQLQNKLMATQDRGSIEFEDMALRLPELLQTGKFANMGIDEVLGTVIGATRKSGSIEKTMTGMRNFILIMEEAQKKGITLTGGYTQKIMQLADMFQTNAPKMQELFGKEVVVHAASVTDAWREVRMEIEALGKVTAKTDAVADKMAKKYSDPTYFAMRDIESLRAMTESAPNIAPDIINASPLMRMHRRGLQGANAVAVGTGGIFGGIGRMSGYLGGITGGPLSQEGAALKANERMDDEEYFKATLRQQFEDKKQADLDAIKQRQAMLFNPFTMWFANPYSIEADKAEIEGRTMSPHLAARGGSDIGPSGGGDVRDSKTHEMLAETNRLLSLAVGDKSTHVVKPGGGTTNATE